MTSTKTPLLRSRGAVLAVLGICLAASCTYLFAKPDTLNFSHRRHSEVGAECTQCHSGVDQSREAGGRHMPGMAVCKDCHDDAFMKDCNHCHTAPEKPQRAQVPATDLTFSHNLHIEKAQAQCITCHPSVAAASVTGSFRLPDHETCTQLCHGQKESVHKSWIADMECYRCHKDLGSKKLEGLTKWTHRRNFVKDHKEGAIRDLEGCMRCHDQSFCADCHSKLEETKPEIKFPDAVDRTFIHRADYVSRHRIEVKADQTQCWSCHGESFCLDCHTREGVTPLSKGTPANPHPSNWVSTHGKVARRDIVQCASCHEQGGSTNCISCHKVGGIGGNPHPKGWNPRLDKDSHTCKLCHEQ